MKRHLLFSFFAAFFFTSSAYACSCLVGVPAHQSFEESDAVFIGTVKSIEGETSFEVGFAVHATWKGSDTDHISIITDQTGGACGYPFEEGKTYVVYAQNVTTMDGSGLHTSICTPTSLFGPKELPKPLSKLGTR